MRVGRWCASLAVAAGLPALHSCGQSPAPAPRAPAVSCYVVRRLQAMTVGHLELLFPYFFGLDTARAARAAVPGYRVLLPRDDLLHLAGSWDWHSEGDSLVISVVADGEGYRLAIRPAQPRWTGELTGWSGNTRMRWTMSGGTTGCPTGLVAAGSEP